MVKTIKDLFTVSKNEKKTTFTTMSAELWFAIRLRQTSKYQLARRSSHQENTQHLPKENQLRRRTRRIQIYWAVVIQRINTKDAFAYTPRSLQEWTDTIGTNSQFGSFGKDVVPNWWFLEQIQEMHKPCFEDDSDSDRHQVEQVS